MTDITKQLAEALHYYEQALLTAFPHGAYGQVFESWDRARKALNAYDAEQAAGQELSPGDFICEDRDSPWLICKPCAADGKCARVDAAEQAAQAVPAGFVLVPVEFIEAGQRVAREYARTNPKWPRWDNGEAEPKIQDPCGVHAWLEQAAMLAERNKK